MGHVNTFCYKKTVLFYMKKQKKGEIPSCIRLVTTSTRWITHQGLICDYLEFLHHPPLRVNCSKNIKYYHRAAALGTRDTIMMPPTENAYA